MSRRIIAFVALALALAPVFVGLGFWQVRRLEERRARNRALASRLAEPEVAFEQLQDTASFRRATIAGIPDYDNEIILTGRSRYGSPGVYILTPVRRAGHDTAVIVIRGWLYAPDAASGRAGSFGTSAERRSAAMSPRCRRGLQHIRTDARCARSPLRGFDGFCLIRRRRNTLFRRTPVLPTVFRPGFPYLRSMTDHT